MNQLDNEISLYDFSCYIHENGHILPTTHTPPLPDVFLTSQHLLTTDLHIPYCLWVGQTLV